MYLQGAQYLRFKTNCQQAALQTELSLFDILSSLMKQRKIWFFNNDLIINITKTVARRYEEKKIHMQKKREAWKELMEEIKKASRQKETRKFYRKVNIIRKMLQTKNRDV
jgi:hypothetical protein